LGRKLSRRVAQELLNDTGMRFRPEEDPTNSNTSDDPFAEFPAEPAVSVEIPKNRDWLAEFPDEQSSPSPEARSKSWRRLSETVKDEKA
jgi:hypothetical protein